MPPSRPPVREFEARAPGRPRRLTPNAAPRILSERRLSSPSRIRSDRGLCGSIVCLCGWICGVHRAQRGGPFQVQNRRSERERDMTTAEMALRSSSRLEGLATSRTSASDLWMRSRAWMPVFSSVLTTWPPLAASRGASAYVWHTLRTSASYCSGFSSLSFEVSQYCVL